MAFSKTPCCTAISMFALFVFITFCSITVVAGQKAPCETSRGFGIYIEDVPETWTVGTVLSHLDISGSDDEITLSVREGDTHFSFDARSRNVTVVQPLTLDGIPQKSYQMKLSCLIKNIGKVDLILKVIVVDVNNNAPQFARSVYRGTVNELAPVGTTVLTGIQATDDDVQNIYVEYQIVEGNHSEYFDISQPSVGAIVLKKMVDYETMTSCNFQIIAKDNHPKVPGQRQVQLTSTASVVITVEDGDDLNPVFQKPAYTATVKENADEGTVLDVAPSIMAFDQDSINSSVTFGIIENDESNLFKIDAKTAVVSLKKGALKRGSKYSVLLKVTQVDNPDRYSSSLLNVRVDAVNENPPRFRQAVYSTQIVENIPIHTTILTVSAIDNDEGAILVYRFVNSDNNKDFAIDAKSGVLSSTRELDFETRPSYNITVEVFDGKYVDRCQVVITLVDINDNSPMFASSTYQFEGKRETDMIVGEVKASDADKGSILHYSLHTHTSLFSINKYGEISIIAESATEDLPDSVYSLLVKVVDDGRPPRESAALVQVNFEAATTPVAVVTETRQTELVVIILLAVLAGCLLLVVITMLVYIKNKLSMS